MRPIDYAHRPRPAGPALEMRHVLAGALALLGVFYFYSGFSGWSLQHSLLPVTPGQVIILFVAGGAVLGLANLVKGRRLPWALLLAAGSYLALIAFNSIFNTHDPLLVRDRTAFMLSLIAALFVMSSVRRFDRVVTALQWVLVACCLLNLVDYFAHGAIPLEMSPLPDRAAGFHLNPNTAAGYIAMAVPVACAMARRKVALAFYALSFVGVLVTFSRGGLILWIAAVFMTEMFIRNREAPGKNAVAVGLAFALVGAALLAFGPAIADGVASLLGDYISPGTRSRLVMDTHDYAAQQRFYGARAAWDLFLNYPLTGSGLGLLGRWQFNEMSHNTLLQALAELGLLGGLWIGLFVGCLLRIGGPFGLTLAALWVLHSLFSHNMLDHTAMAVIIGVYWAGAERSRTVYAATRRRPAPAVPVDLARYFPPSRPDAA